MKASYFPMLGLLCVVGYHGIDTERLHSSAHPSLVVANTQFSSTILISVKSLLLGAIPEPDTYWRHSFALTYTTSSDIVYQVNPRDLYIFNQNTHNIIH